MKLPRALPLAALVLVSACTQAPRPVATDDPAKDPRPTPSLVLDAAPAPEPSALELLQQHAEEIASLETRLAEAEKAMSTSGVQLKEAMEKAERNAAETERLRSLLDGSLENQRAVDSALLSTRIRELRLEQQLLELRLAELVKDAP